MDRDAGPLLISIARGAIAAAFGAAQSADNAQPWLSEPGASFVTLRKAGRLRGCVGSLTPTASLREDVKSNAQAAAFRDPRFPALTAEEFPATRIEVSVLSPLTRMEFCSEGDLAVQLRPGEDGVTLAFDGRCATFLPQVWEELDDARRFLTQLKLKAGLAPEFWSPAISVSRYSVSKWTES